jgi:hypothetical protein
MFKIYFLNVAAGFLIGGGMVYFYFRLKNTPSIEMKTENDNFPETNIKYRKLKLKMMFIEFEKLEPNVILYQNTNSNYATFGDLCSKSAEYINLEKQIISELKSIFIGKEFSEVKEYIEKELKCNFIVKPDAVSPVAPTCSRKKSIVLIVNNESLIKNKHPVGDFYKVSDEKAIVQDILFYENNALFYE